MAGWTNLKFAWLVTLPLEMSLACTELDDAVDCRDFACSSTGPWKAGEDKYSTWMDCSFCFGVVVPVVQLL